MANKLIKKCKNCNEDYEYLYKRRKTTQFCSKGCSVSYRQKIHDPNFLSEENELKYYMLGLIFADGSLSKQDGKNERLTLGLTDELLIKKLKPYVCPDRKLYIKVSDNPNHNDFYSLVNTNEEVLEELKRSGMTNNKAKTITIPDIPTDMMHHFVRGFFDGDGSVYYNKVKSYTYKHCQITTASKKFTEQLNDVLREVGIDSYKGRDSRNTAYHVKVYSKEAIQKLSDYMYEDSTFHMIRKKDKLMNDIV